ncbi:MAG: hypothetical protein M1838_003417, partial [Thelocarpon superellum]
AASSGQFKILYFASATVYTHCAHEDLPAPMKIADLFALLETKYPGIADNVLSCCAVTKNLVYLDLPEVKQGGSGEGGEREEDGTAMILPGDEMALIPPVSAG